MRFERSALKPITKNQDFQAKNGGEIRQITCHFGLSFGQYLDGFLGNINRSAPQQSTNIFLILKPSLYSKLENT